MTGIVAAIGGTASNKTLQPGLLHRAYSGYLNLPSSMDSATPYATTIDTSTINAAYSGSSNLSDLWTGYYKAPSTGNITITLNLDYQDESNVQGYVWAGASAETGYSAANALINGFGSGNFAMLVGQFYAIRVQFAYDGQPSFFFPNAEASTTLSINGTSALLGSIFYNTLTTGGI